MNKKTSIIAAVLLLVICLLAAVNHSTTNLLNVQLRLSDIESGEIAILGNETKYYRSLFYSNQVPDCLYELTSKNLKIVEPPKLDDYEIININVKSSDGNSKNIAFVNSQYIVLENNWYEANEKVKSVWPAPAAGTALSRTDFSITAGADNITSIRIIPFQIEYQFEHPLNIGDVVTIEELGGLPDIAGLRVIACDSSSNTLLDETIPGKQIKGFICDDWVIEMKRNYTLGTGTL